jgi:type IV secretory pathway VirB6-like protein
MANQHYKLINEPVFEIDGKLYQTQTWNLNLEQFLIQNAGKEIYIYAPSVETNQIRAIVK